MFLNTACKVLLTLVSEDNHSLLPWLVWVVLLFVFQSSPLSQTTLENPFKKKYVDLYLKILNECYVALQPLRIKETYSKIKIFTFKSQLNSLF